MRITRFQVLFSATVLCLAVILTGCRGSSTPTAEPLTTSNVKTILREMFLGYNQVDYATFSKDMSPALKRTIDETSFKDFCAASVKTLGAFRYVQTVEQATSDNSDTSWLVTVKFEKSTVSFNVTINAAGQVNGMNFGPGQ